MTDRELMQQALDLLDDINQCSLPPTGIPLPAEIDHVMEALRARLAEPEQLITPGGGLPNDHNGVTAAQPEQEPVATLFGSLPVYDVPPAKPVAWVENLENAQPHCVTDLKYCSVMQHERGEHLKYIPLYTAPPHFLDPAKVARLMDEAFERGKKEVDMEQVKDIAQKLADCAVLNSAPPQREWQGLTDEEVKAAWSQLWYDLGNGKFAASDDPARHTTIMFAKEIEAKLKEKNNA